MTVCSKIIAAVMLLGAAPAAAQYTPPPYPLPPTGGYPFPNAGAPLPLPGPSVEQLQAELKLRSGSDTVYFDAESHQLDRTAQAILARQAEWLRANPFVRISIEGHADGRQTRDQALALGERRAAAVRDYLLRLGVFPAQLAIVSWGKERPVGEGADEASWARNSRVVTRIAR
jgi:peptidoglycan-associated lipoprotein